MLILNFVTSWSMFACLFGVFAPLENFHSYRDDTITGEGLQNVDLCPALMAIEQWGFLSVPHLLWNMASVYDDPWHSQPIPVLGLSRLGFEHPTFQGERSNLLRHRRAFMEYEVWTHCRKIFITRWRGLFIFFSPIVAWRLSYQH